MLVGLIVALAGCSSLGLYSCPGIPNSTASFLLPVRLPDVPGWNWSYAGDIPLHVQNAVLLPGVLGLEELHFRRDQGNFVTLKVEDWSGQAYVFYGDDIRADGIVERERTWFRGFVADVTTAGPELSESLAADYATVHQGGGPLSGYGVRFDASLLKLDSVWNATKPIFEKVGGNGGDLTFGSCYGSLCFLAGDIEWQFVWVHNREGLDGVGQTSIMSGVAYTNLPGPLIEGTPWGSIQVTIPGSNLTNARAVAAAWSVQHGFPPPSNVLTETFDGCTGSEWPQTTKIEDLNLKAPIQA